MSKFNSCFATPSINPLIKLFRVLIVFFFGGGKGEGKETIKEIHLGFVMFG